MRWYRSSSAKSRSEQSNGWYKSAMRILLVTLLPIVVVPAYGSIIMFSGEVNVLPSPPAAILYGASNSTIYGFAEQQGVLLTSNLNVGITSPGTWICCSGIPGGTIDAGTTVNSYLLYASPTSDISGANFTDFTGSITFSPGEKIVGVIITYQQLSATDTLLGSPTTTYPPLSDVKQGLEQFDVVSIGNGDETLHVNFHIAAGNVDMIRILTTTPEPAGFMLLGSGLIALALCRKRLRFGRAGRQD